MNARPRQISSMTPVPIWHTPSADENPKRHWIFGCRRWKSSPSISW